MNFAYSPDVLTQAKSSLRKERLKPTPAVIPVKSIGSRFESR
jgi:hypothetical protein